MKIIKRDGRKVEFDQSKIKDAILKAYEISQENDVILLSPASASWDQYKQCEDRGAEFKNIVNNLIDNSK